MKNYLDLKVDKDYTKIKEASKFTRIFKSSNMSLGVNVLINLSKQATNTLGNIADIEIIEKHHNKKVDAPSGTAKMIANAINKELDDLKLQNEKIGKIDIDKH